MRKKKFSNFWVIFCIAFFALLILLFSTPSAKNAVFNITFPIQKLMFQKGNNFFKNIDIFKNTREIREEVERLRIENRELIVALSQLKEIKTKNEVLEKALDVNFSDDRDFVFGEVFGKDLLNHNLIIRHRGVVTEGDPVTNHEGVLIGTIEKTYGEYSRVKLITHPETSLEVKVQNSDEPIGVLRGGGGMELIIDLLPKGKELRRGNMVITISQENELLKGLFIGRIYEIEDDDMEAFVTAKVWQGIDPRYFEYVFIIIGE